jgi:IS30 family transposase
MRRSKPVDPNGDRRGHIKDIISISQRPAAVEDRAVPGHWEGDLLSGQNNSYIATLVERHTRYVMLAKVAGKDTQTVVSALIKQAKKLPTELYKSLTWDRGKELIVALRWRPTSTFIFAIHKARGSAGRTRTPTAC